MGVTGTLEARMLGSHGVRDVRDYHFPFITVNQNVYASKESAEAALAQKAAEVVAGLQEAARVAAEFLGISGTKELT